MVYGKMNTVLVCMADTQDSDRSSLVPRSSTFYCSSVCIQCNTRKQKSSKQRGRPQNTYHVNEVWWTWGGHMGGGAHLTNSFAINHRATFLPVESSTINLMNVWGPGNRWSARWLSLVRNLNVDPSPHTSTSNPPNVIHMIGVPRPSPFFTALILILNANWRTKNGRGLGMRLVQIIHSYIMIKFKCVCVWELEGRGVVYMYQSPDRSPSLIRCSAELALRAGLIWDV